MEDVTNDNPDIKTDNNEVHTTGIFIIYHYISLYIIIIIIY